MKEIATISQATAYLEKMFTTLNLDKFEGALPSPMITIQSDAKSYGYCTVSQVWRINEGGRWEINLSAEYLNRPIEETVCTLLHEMVHLLHRIQGVQGTSRGGYYHNQHFKDSAEGVGLIVTYDKRVGYGVTEPGDELKVYIQKKRWSNIPFARYNFDTDSASDDSEDGEGDGEDTPKKKTSSTRKYSCPCCGQSVRATKKVNLLCGDCKEKMLSDRPEDEDTEDEDMEDEESA